jgi:hypothetical protein
MKRFFLTISFLLLTSPVFAQDVDLIGAGGIGDLLDIPAPRGAAPPRGGAPARGGAPTAPPVDRLVRLRELMNQASAPLNKEQETGLNNLINSEIPMMRQALQRKAMQIQMQKGGMPPRGGTGPAGAPDTKAPVPPPAQAAAPPPGAPAGARGPNPAAAMLAGITPEDIAPEIIRLNDQLLGKIAAAPMLTPPQQAVIKKIYKDQIKAHGGFEAIKMTMDDANVSFTAEQVAQIQPLFDEQEKVRIQLIKENQGQPLDKAKQDQLQRETLAKVLKLLTPAQRTALLAPAKPPGKI